MKRKKSKAYEDEPDEAETRIGMIGTYSFTEGKPGVSKVKITGFVRPKKGKKRK